MSRYMDQASKAREMAQWARAKADREARPPQGFTGGHGYPDPEIYGHVDRLNGLHHLCTLQSCAGHVCTPDLHCSACAGGWRCGVCGSNSTDCFYRQQSNYTKQDRVAAHAFRPERLDTHVWNGQLWLWADDKLGPWFLQHAPRLARAPHIEKVSVLWHVDGREIIDIQFKGIGHCLLGISMALVCTFFEDGNMECNL